MKKFLKSYDSKLKQEQDALLCAGCDDDRHKLENFSSRVTFVIRVTRTCPIFRNEVSESSKILRC